MPDTPTFANLLTRWSSGGPAVRASVYAHLRADPAEAAAAEAFLRDELNAAFPYRRVIAAEAVVELYGDEDAAATALAWVMRQDDPAAAADSIAVMRKLSPGRAGPLLADFALHAPAAFRGLTPDALRWAGGTAIRCGARGPEVWLALFNQVDAAAESALLVGLADGAAHATCDPSPVLDAVGQRLFHAGPGYAAGAALWRLTWRVHRDWLASIDPHSPRFENDSPLLAFLVEVLVEHLGRRPDLAPLVRDLLVRLAADALGQFAPAARRVAKFGARGWAVLLPVLGDAKVPPLARASVFREAVKRAAVWPLAHHHARGVILERTRDPEAVPPELLGAAGMVLYSLGPQAAPAVPDLLDLIARQPDTAGELCKVVAFTASGHPNADAAVARTLDRLRRSVVFAADAFAALAKVYAWLAPAGAAALVEDASSDPRTAETLLRLPEWKDAPPDVRRRHAAALANCLGSPRAEARARAADALRQYTDQLPAVWPAIVALLACGDEKAVTTVLPQFRHLAPEADAVTAELRELFREPNPVYAARAVVALWHLGRMPLIAAELREAVTAPDDARGWAVLRGAVDRVGLARDLLVDLSSVFADVPPEVVAKVKVHAILNPPEADEEVSISLHVPRPDDATRPQVVNWDGVFRCVGTDPEGALLVLALMCAFSAGGFSGQRIWLIKQQWALTGLGLADARDVVDRVLPRLTATATPGEKRAAIRDFFTAAALPKAVTDLIAHRLSWYRWAGLELLDAWGEPERVAEWIGDRLRDRSALVRTRALRMNHG